MDTSGDSYSISLQLVSTLDREVQDRYSLTVFAFDGESPFPQNSSSPFPPAELQIEIEISDVNDNAPVFQITDYYIEKTIPIDVNTYLAQVEAVDADIGLNGQVEYALESSTQPNSGLFFVYPDSGWVQLVAPFSSNANYSETLTIAAK